MATVMNFREVHYMLRSLWPSVSWRQVLVSLCEMALVAGCAGASVSKVQTPLPADVRVWKPPADTPEPVAAFSGVWAGRFGEWVAHGLGAGSSSVYHTLVVENIGYTGLDTYRASVIYSWGPDVSRPPGFARTSGMIGTDGVLRLSTFGNGARVSYKMSPDRTMLSVLYESGTETTSGLLWRSQLENSL